MRMTILAVLLLVLGAAPAIAAPPSIQLAHDAEARWVSFDLTPGNQIRFHMEVNGKPATAILDTGVSVSVASAKFARTAGLRISAKSEADAIGGNVAIGWAAPRAIELGGLKRKGGRIAVADLTAMATGSATPVDMLIGSDILSCCAIDIDYDARRFRILPSGRMPFRGVSAPLSLSRGSKVYVSELTLGRQHIKPVLVDTGDGAAVTVTQSTWKKSGLKPKAVTSAVAYGLGGPIETRLTILPELHVDGLTAHNVELRIEDDMGFSTKTGTLGRIGSAFLQRYRVLLDPHAGHIVFRPGKKVDEVPIRSTSGLLVGLDRDRLRVLHVMKNSPAAHDGWQDGDTICRVDGSPIAGNGLSADTSWSAGPPGEVVKLGMCDGTKRALTLAQFY
ncbi:aspartyl protease family protein [Stakelama marina]|uniref:Aspartyl protease family protein n=1 Tax=Stakelama marina TaxID=2826939 RepID=A0A8T4IG15_9SPHN|nr:aspartyl protease family protein [Stakelama marina]MBR0553401.1 aspartyl protease family protein [Stakelama marina]